MSMEINFASHVLSPLWIIGGNAATLQIMLDNVAYVYQKDKQVKELRLEGFSNSEVHSIYSSFANCIHNGGKLAVTLDEAIETIKILDQIRYYAQQRKELKHGNFIFSSSV